MDPMPPSPPSSPPPDPFAQYDPTGPTPPSGTGAKVLGIVIVALVLVGLLAGGIFLFTQGGGDDGDDASASATEPADDQDQDEDDEFADFSDDFSDEFEEVEEPDEPGGEPSDTVPPPTTVPAGADYLDGDTQPLIDVFTEAVGPQADVVQVLVYEDYGFITVRDPDRPNRVLEYRYLNGELEDPETDAPFPGTNLDTETFPLDAVAWDRLPLLASRAPERAGFPNGHVTHVIVESDQPFSDRFIMRIYVTSADEVESDYVVATLDGRFTTR